MPLYLQKGSVTYMPAKKIRVFGCGRFAVYAGVHSLGDFQKDQGIEVVGKASDRLKRATKISSFTPDVMSLDYTDAQDERQ
jgi:hypothetical protein